MCFGQPQVQSPTIQYVGPSEEDIARNEEQLATFQQNLLTQQEASAASIQSQIDLANARTEEIRAALDTEIAGVQSETSAAQAAADDAAKEAAAAAGATYTPFGAYGVTATQSEAPAATTTKAITKKKKDKSTLKIAQNAAAALAGSGLNIGV